MLKQHNRGQAIPEFAITIGLLVSAMMFIFVVARYGMIGERAATALRIAGTVTQNQNPYRFASLDTVYQAADNAYNASSDQQTCTPPDSRILYGEGLLNGAASASFWNPSSIPLAPTCAFSMTLFRNTAIRTEGDLLIHQFDYSISAEAGGWTSAIANAAGSLFGGTRQSIAESARFYQAPSLETLIQCYTHLGPAVSATLNPAKDVSNAQPTAPLSLGEAAAIRTSLIISPTACTGLALAPGPYQIPPQPLPFPTGAAPAGTFPWKTPGTPGSGSSRTTPGGKHGTFHQVNAYQPPSTPAPSGNGGSGSHSGGSRGGSSGGSGSSSPGGSKSGGSGGSSGSSGPGSGSGSSGNGSTGGSGGSGSGTITL
jgi:uncharacterized membrane protein YgcG